MKAVMPTNRLELTLLRWGRIAAAVVLIRAALTFAGWATGIQLLTRIHPDWPPMSPWTAVWLAALAVAILVQSGCPSPGRVWVGRGLAAIVGVMTLAVLAEYATGRSFGVDTFWFGDAVRRIQPILPGRPSPQAAASAFLLSLLSIAVAFNRGNLPSRPWARKAWEVSLVAAMIMPLITIMAYLFGVFSRTQIAPSMTTAVSFLLLGAATVLLQPAWLIVRSDRLSLIRLGMILAGFPLLIGLSWRAFLALGLAQDLALTFATATASTVLGTAAYRLSRQEHGLTQQLQVTADRLTEGLGSAAAYVSSILPGELEGRVRVSSRYLPSQELAGDSFDYRWIDDDHLIAYLIDVSGHGIEPALLSVSVHNLLRSGSLPRSTLLAPDHVLAELNRLFQMDKHGEHYLTMWVGVYEASSRTLRYASAGAPPAFATTADATGSTTELATDGQPLGMFVDTTYTGGNFTVPPGGRILLFSDGAYEDARIDGRRLSLNDFKNLFARLDGSSLDHLVETLRGLIPSGAFGDDCSLVNMAFD